MKIQKAVGGFFVSVAAAVAFALLAWVVMVLTFKTLRAQAQVSQ